MDTLRGSLDTFSLPDIVTLIATSGKTGVLAAETFRLKGRIYIAEGAVTYATTRGDDGDIEDLREMSEAHALDSERRGRKEPAPGQTLQDLVEQQIVEVFVRLTRMSGGKFSFEEGKTSRALGDGIEISLDVPGLIARATERIAEWEDIESVVPSSSTKFSLNNAISDDGFEVTLDARSWTFLAAIGSTASVQDLAERLRIFEFPAAKKVAEFVRRGLLVAEEPRETVSVQVAVSEPSQGAPSDTATGRPGPVDAPPPPAETRVTPPIAASVEPPVPADGDGVAAVAFEPAPRPEPVPHDAPPVAATGDAPAPVPAEPPPPPGYQGV